MQRAFNFVRVTLIGGIFFLVPVIVMVAVIQKALVIANKLVTPLAKLIPFGFATPKLLAAVLLIALCFAAGILARVAVARKITGWLETTLLSNLPGYEFLKRIGQSALGVESEESHKVVLVGRGDFWQLGFLIERLKGGYLAVFIPGAPNPHSGSIQFLKEDRVRAIEVPEQSALKILKRLGVGASTLLASEMNMPASGSPPELPTANQIQNSEKMK
jgi:uncharacterized membrane protein